MGTGSTGYGILGVLEVPLAVLGVVVVVVQLLLSCLSIILGWLWLFLPDPCGLTLCNIFPLCLLTVPLLPLMDLSSFIVQQILLSPCISCLISFCDTVNTTASYLSIFVNC